MSDRKKLIFIALNELNFEAAKLYNLDNFPNLKKIINNSEVTFSEKDYEKLEPWIQWLTIYTGLSADEHNVSRLGDVSKKNFKNVFLEIENQGFKVGAIGPMNLNNNLKNPVFFIPDPWTATESDNSFFSKIISKTLSNFVNNNANNKFRVKDYCNLLIIFLKYFRIKNLNLYLELLLKSFKYKFYKAIFLDLLINDIFFQKVKKEQVNFSHLFLNGIAHVQHHYFLNSKINNSKIKNPEWYIEEKKDPFFDILIYYENIIKDYLSDNKIEILIATGLTQIPYDREKFYYRLKNHNRFLKHLKIDFKEILPRMSRDFLIKFNNASVANIAEKQLGDIIEQNNNKLFGIIENRGDELFVTLTYPNEIKTDTKFKIKDVLLTNLFDEVSLVAIKNGMHSSRGFVYSSAGIKRFISNNYREIDIKSINRSILNFFKNE